MGLRGYYAKTEKNKCHDFTSMWNLKVNKKENRPTNIENKLMVAKREGG